MGKMKKAPPTFNVVLKGPNITPERVHLRQLSELLGAVQVFAGGHDVESEEDAPVDEETLAISLVDVKRGSAVFQCHAPDAKTVLANLRLTGKYFTDPSSDDDNRFGYSLRGLDKASAIARSLGCDIRIYPLNENAKPLVEIMGETYKRVAKSIFVSGESQITGEVRRVGGSTRIRCAMRVDDRHKLLFCTVKHPEVARKLGQQLYQRVVVSGTARWFQKTWRLYSFTIREVLPAKRRPLSESIRALRDAGGKAWESVEDPESFLRELR